MRHVTGAERSFFRRSYGRQDIPSLYAPPGRPDADFEEADPAHAARDLERLVTSSSRSGAVPDASLVIQPGAGHSPWLDDAGWFAAAASAFLDDG
jgi:pimeloyl-ACP methyl ester carboxylesterase